MPLINREKKPLAACDLCDLTRGLQEAAAATNDLVAHQYAELFDAFFDHDGDPNTPMVPRTLDVQMGEGHQLQVPLISLITPRSLLLDSMEVNLSVRVHGSERTHLEGKCLPESDNEHERFFVTLGPDAKADRAGENIQMRLTFKAGEPPEAVRRLIDEYTQLIAPKARPPEPDEFVRSATIRRP